MTLNEIFNDPNISNDEFVIALGQAYQKHIDSLEGTFIINPPQYQRFIEASTYLKSLVNEFGGRVEYFELNPKERHGLFSVLVEFVDFTGKEKEAFISMLQNVDGVDITPSADGKLILGINVNNVFIKAD